MRDPTKPKGNSLPKGCFGCSTGGPARTSRWVPARCPQRCPLGARCENTVFCANLCVALKKIKEYFTFPFFTGNLKCAKMLRFYSGQAAGTSAGTWRAPSGHPAGRTCWQCWTPRQPGTRGPLSAGMSKEGDPRLWSITQKNTPVHSTAWFGKMCFRSGGGMSGSVPSFTVKFCIGAFLTEAVKWIAK